MKVAITGAGGMLGSDMTEVFGKTCEVFPLARNDLDITDSEAVMKKITEISPDVVINCAAIADVDACEANQEAAYEVNGYGAGYVARACSGVGAKLVQISTDYVFNGEKGAVYVEDDMPSPINVYGNSKLLGEERVNTLCKQRYVIRTQWLYGANGDNFIKKIVAAAEKDGRVKAVNDQFGSPTYTEDLAKAVRGLVERNTFGTFHVTNSGICSRYEFTLELFRLLNIEAPCEPCLTREYPRPAKRPAYTPLKNRYYILNGNNPLRSWENALRSYLTKNPM